MPVASCRDTTARGVPMQGEWLFGHSRCGLVPADGFRMDQICSEAMPGGVW